MEHEVENVTIIGSGPAAFTAAIYAARAELKPLEYEGAITEENRLAGTLPLGQLNWTTEVENFPGFPDGIQGPDLMLKMREQAVRYGTRIVTQDVTELDLSERPFKLKGSDGKEWKSRTVIIATGASARYLDIPGEREFANKGVSACAVCDGALPRFRDKSLVVVGGGDTAAEEATYLTKFADHIHLLVRRGEMRASKVMQQRVFDNDKITVHWHTKPLEVLGTDADGVTGVKVEKSEVGDVQTIDCVGVFVAIGHRPNTSFLADQVHMEEGFVKLTDPFHTFTSVEGVFAAGDVADPTYKQAVTAAGMGCKAALDAEHFLASKGEV
ncbi:MAG: thioredoxin-disulfide reductase [Planctomycetota bacterium]